MTHVVEHGICAGCGACLIDAHSDSRMILSDTGSLVPAFNNEEQDIDPTYWEACPGKGVDYPKLYYQHYGRLPTDWCVGIAEDAWVGYSTENSVRRAAASGGITTSVLVFLLETGRIDAAIVAMQDHPHPGTAGWYVARSREEILRSSQSVYTPVSMLDSLRYAVTGERYAITCLPEQSSALRVLQYNGNLRAQQVKFVLGPYTGTSLKQGAINTLLRSHRIPRYDSVVSLRWRAGEWPGHLEIRMNSGRIIRSKKAYYNYLIPFYISDTSLQSMDFANEFADLSVGDAWSPRYESQGMGFSVIVARNKLMSSIIEEMERNNLISIEARGSILASSMHGHMIDFKKRGSYLRNSWRRSLGRAAPDCGLRPLEIGLARKVIELVISSIFHLGQKNSARILLEHVPESFIGPAFERLRRYWKRLSKAIKRGGLDSLNMVPRSPYWRRLE